MDKLSHVKGVELKSKFNKHDRDLNGMFTRQITWVNTLAILKSGTMSFNSKLKMLNEIKEQINEFRNRTGYSHGDIRAANILVKNTHRKKVVVELTDFDIQRSMEKMYRMDIIHASLHPIMIYFQGLIKN